MDKGAANTEASPGPAGDCPLKGHGRAVPRREGKLFLLSDAAEAFLVLAGRVDLFAVGARERRLPLGRVETGELMLGLDGALEEGGPRILAVSEPGTELLALSRAELAALGGGEERGSLIAGLLAGWLSLLVQSLEPGLAPKDVLAIPPEGQAEVPAGSSARPAASAAFWRWEGVLELLGEPEMGLTGDGGLLPIPKEAWLTAPEDLSLMSLPLEQGLRDGTSWPGVERFHRLFGRAVSRRLNRLEALEEQGLEHRRLLDQAFLNRTYQRIADIFNPDLVLEELTLPSLDHLFLACRLVGLAQDIEFRAPAEVRRDKARTPPDHSQALRDIARTSRVMMRNVALKGKWWTGDVGALLGFWGQEAKPVALLPESPGRYEMVDPESGDRREVDAALAREIKPEAVFFYRSLPQIVHSGKKLVSFGFRGCKPDLNIILAMVLVAGLLSLVTPLGTEVIFSDVIPKANMSYLWQVFLVLLACYLAGGALNMVRDFAVLRIAGKMESSLEAAVWDRLLNLPAPFFKKYPSGDLALRAMGINSIRQMASNVVVTNTLGGLASSLNLFLMLYYSWRLTLVGLAMALLAVGATVVTTRAQLAHQRRVYDIQGKISALVIQMVRGVNKLRTAGAENRAFAVWAEKFSSQKQESLKAGKISNVLQAINAAFSILATAAIYTWLVFFDTSDISMSQFLAFNAAFGIFFQACMMMSTSLIALLNAVPLYERLRPIVEAEPETDPAKGRPGELSGRIVLHKVSFRYQSDGPQILHGINLDIEPGEFVALVGPSGSGKSTLLRLLLGFESPEEGSVFYDQYDLSRVDSHEIRRQIGVVLQNAQLMTGTIFSNIVGSANLSQDQAWEAAALAGLDQDIKAMPMGMETMVSEGGSTLSGGQRQRLLIARALVKKPRIIFFDEATSALDNRTQSVVGKSLKELRVTRLVIAHRLSTVINADRIVVLKDGKIVEQGTYQALVTAGGEFESLARRQLA